MMNHAHVKALPGGIEISDDRHRLDSDRVHGWIASTYWSPGISKERWQRAVDHSTVVAGLYHERHGQMGFLRVVTDFTRFAYLMDVYVDEDHRGQGLGKALVDYILRHPALDDVDTWTLATETAQDLYAPFGFRPPENPDRWMVCKRRND